MQEVAATLLNDRMMLRDLGVLHLGILPPAGRAAPYRLVLTPSEAEGSQVWDAARRSRWEGSVNLDEKRSLAS
jgi:hypothetical protein